MGIARRCIRFPFGYKNKRGADGISGGREHISVSSVCSAAPEWRFIMEETINIRELIREAAEARKTAYTPYSHFQVGAALLTASGKIYRGCNIENAGYTPSNCAERTAFFKAVSEGEREFKAIAVTAGKEGGSLEMTAPCGVCRQVMMEFCDYDNFCVIMAASENEYRIMRLRELLPLGFGPDNLK